LTKRLTLNTPRLALVGIAAVAVVGAAAVTASAVTGNGDTPNAHASNPHTGDPVAYGPVLNAQAAKGAKIAPLASMTPDALGRRVASALSPSGLVRAVTLSPGTSTTPSALTVQLNENEETVPQMWDSNLALGAAAQLSATTQATIDQVISSATAIGPNAKGTPTSTDLGVGAVALNQSFDSPSDADLTSHVSDVAKQFGLTVSSVQILHPLESALSVTFNVADDASINWTIDQLRDALVGTTPDVEGVFIQINGPGSTPLLQEGAAYRTGGGGLWFANGQDSRFGALHGGAVVKQ
jgi:hypothetical protein